MHAQIGRPMCAAFFWTQTLCARRVQSETYYTELQYLALPLFTIISTSTLL